MTNNSNDGANALLNRSSSKGISWDDIGKGVWITGAVLEHGVEQCKKWDAREKKWSDELDFWPDGDPKMQIVIELQTELRADEDDDGKRTLRSGPYSAKGKRNIIDATKAALAEANAPGLETGAKYAICWVDGAGESGDPRRFEVKYRRPVTEMPGEPAQQPAPAAPALDDF